MRGTSSGPCSYRFALNDSDGPMPSGGITSPTRPFPMKGEGDRPTSDVVSRNPESAGDGACCWAGSHDERPCRHKYDVSTTVLILTPVSRPAANLVARRRREI